MVALSASITGHSNFGRVRMYLTRATSDGSTAGGFSRVIRFAFQALSRITAVSWQNDGPVDASATPPSPYDKLGRSVVQPACPRPSDLLGLTHGARLSSLRLQILRGGSFQMGGAMLGLRRRECAGRGNQGRPAGRHESLCDRTQASGPVRGAAIRHA